MQDIGRHNAAGEDAAAQAAIGTRLPPEIAVLVEGEDGVSRPDILIAHRLDMPHLTEIHIVEIKYCRDTDRTGKQQEGAAQHEVLTRKLREKYPGRVHMHVITLGVAGTIYNDIIIGYTGLHSRLGCWPGNRSNGIIDKAHHTVNFLFVVDLIH